MELEIALAVPIRKRPSMSRIPLDVEEGVFYTGTHVEKHSPQFGYDRDPRTASAISFSEY